MLQGFCGDWGTAMQGKKCTMCSIVLPLSDFCKAKRNKDGLSYTCKKCCSNSRRNYSKTAKGREADKRGHLKAKYGITLETYDQIVKIQGGTCAICHTKETAKNQYGVMRLSVDHDHKTGKVRGLLCDKCNRGVGCFNDDPKILAEAIRYLL